MDDLLLHNPAVAALAIQVAPLKRDRLDLQRLIGRYGEGTTLGQALATARREIEAASQEYREIKARGETL
ncbi:MAG: hypothetical protein HY794_13420 [Desulfarculus sp.]|nr:hypothetical protein [Desulfarculus sp.]